ncbi:MAG TPA: WYL domain-containing protein [Chloroflexia bacterium]|nr:WYL domain-containing protein [Chloroflexia bacterium]
MVANHAGQMKVYRVSQVIEAQIKAEHFERAADFDLVAFWQKWCLKLEQRRSRYQVTARVAPELLPELRYYFGDELQSAIKEAKKEADGWVTMVLPFERLEDARNRLLGFGRVIEVLEPEALRKSLADFACQIVDLYSARPPDVFAGKRE